ncbi:hypothetical protein M2459_003637 [Parabacteroides sp. PF5-5]|uniref:DUF6642 family protein n=1 Tax=unclassified Parabacteroides TaxID=2649774 RepID=UPI00247CB712|nr:hypothetical protein [Parabacteroides sp. PH5-39]MDH6316228.1 hypothetical protein [Parabacteroides sp. PF5-13]MDH6321451.1 hypothetical protein [Parabacteroides sp. PH5-13]MDH6325182.1 hypothetical protein [Parabacteroides sp. PH5-8]MDH6329060.1 hypothetical protein [Parabacteroides sp. PH5-41]MDH6336862.1 hypothetical protein [Parabacteroides sp. PF5-5]MDH6347935.1 hypothetical protein [Parabacteroides sp. PH5-46]MDH6361241.1 hypothetical protein [Parabacteroides sp. PH5-16]MDH6376787.
MKNREKYIYCLEGNWNRNPRSKQSIKPILDLLHTFSRVKYIYRKCFNKEDFLKGLQTFAQKRYANYTVLYIAFHGRKNRVYFGNEYVTLKEIANTLEGKLKGKIVHFGSCSTLRTSEKNISDFITRTGCSCISGYERNVEYIASTAFELLYFETLQKQYSRNKLKVIISERFPALVEKLRFVIA